MRVCVCAGWGGCAAEEGVRARGVYVGRGGCVQAG